MVWRTTLGLVCGCGHGLLFSVEKFKNSAPSLRPFARASRARPDGPPTGSACARLQAVANYWREFSWRILKVTLRV